jgi:hypothetical protein
MYFVGPNAGEKYFMRLLLTVVKAPTSYISLCTFEGHTFDTFKETCYACGLLEDDEEWAACLNEASTVKTGSQLHRLFVDILTACSPSNPDELWQRFCLHICDDLCH